MLALRTGQDRARFDIDEQLRQLAAVQPCGVVGNDLRDIAWFSIDRNLARPLQGRQARARFLEGFAMLVLTLPIVHPLILALGYDPIWFGVVMVIVLEMGLISPPVGVNVFVVKGVAEDVPLKQIFAGIIPFWIAMAVCLIILLIFPQIALFLPNTMISG